MQIGVVNEDSCHTSTSTLTSLATRKITKWQQQQPLQQLQRKSRRTNGQCVNKLSFQFRIVVMPQRLQMRLRLSRRAFLASLLLLQLLVVTTPPVCQAVGYSYARFSGPVTGPEQKIIVHDGLAGGGIGGGGGTRVDFIAKPAYEFAYGVEDAQARLLQNRHETRDGDAVHGSYSVVDPDGNLRVVKYTADHINGFQAEVTTNGLNTAVHGHHTLPHTTVQAHPTPTPLWYFPHVAQQQVQHPNTQGNVDYVEDTSAAKGSDKGKGNYEVNDDYEEADNGEERHEEHEQTDAESDENYEDEDEHEDYVNNEHSAEASNEASNEASKEAHSYEEHSEEYY